MNAPRDFKRQYVKTSAQWRSGLAFGVDLLPDGGVATYPGMKLEGTVCAIPNGASACSVAIDECAQIYWIDSRGGVMWFTDPIDCHTRRLIELEKGRSPQGDQPAGRLILAKHVLWWHDRAGDRIVAFARDNYQVLHVIDDVEDLVDFAFDGSGMLYLLSRHGIFPYAIDGFVAQQTIPIAGLSSAAGIAFESEFERLYVLGTAEDAQGLNVPAMLRVEVEPPNVASIYPLRYRAEAKGFDFRPDLVASLHDGSLAIAQHDVPVLFRFDDTGGRVDWVSLLQGGLPDPCDDGEFGPNSPSIVFEAPKSDADRAEDDLERAAQTLVFQQNEPRLCAITSDRNGRILVGAHGAVYSVSVLQTGSQSDGAWYSRSLDSGAVADERWHRLDLFANIPQNAEIDVYYATAGDDADGRSRAQAVNAILSESSLSDVEKRQQIEAELRRSWVGPERFSGARPGEPGVGQGEAPEHSMLFRENGGRFLWLKLELQGHAGSRGPSIGALHVVYPRKTYLRYLPPIYQEEPGSAALLERMLSPFETILEGLDLRLDRLFELFDPDTAPPDFLPWLSRWLNVALDENWSVEVQRKLLNEAVSLYRRRGTPRGLADFVDIVFGRRPVIVESAASNPPFILSPVNAAGADRTGREPVVLGTNSVVGRRQIGGSVVGSTTKIGYSALQSSPVEASAPWVTRAYRFVLLMPMNESDYGAVEVSLRRFVRQQSPAHTVFDIRRLPDDGMGPGGYLEINTKLGGPDPMRLGFDGALGGTIVGSSTDRSQVGIQATLNGSANLT